MDDEIDPKLEEKNEVAPKYRKWGGHFLKIFIIRWHPPSHPPKKKRWGEQNISDQNGKQLV